MAGPHMLQLALALAHRRSLFQGHQASHSMLGTNQSPRLNWERAETKHELDIMTKEQETNHLLVSRVVRSTRRVLKRPFKCRCHFQTKGCSDAQPPKLVLTSKHPTWTSHLVA
ncbi:hypothetical protein BDZ91DRAFT_96740 [Kalaharituber pfeilii]|nr:hypothetical protein BDZ91DRAFT_96740 [Kalaharituber pfeilii]